MHEETQAERPDFDSLIDAALISYGNPDSGFEHRVLASVSAARGKAPRFRRNLWAAALIAAAACLILPVILTRISLVRGSKTGGHNTPILQPLPTGAVQASTSAPPERSRVPHHIQSHRNNGKLIASRLPKREVFPSPRPLSSAEQVLVNFAAKAPKTNRQDFLAGQGHTSEAIAIAAIGIDPIQIPPLETPDSGAN